MPRLVGIDVGDARIGLAISDSGKKIAFPLGVVERVCGSFGFNRIAKLIGDREVEAFVVGLPLRTDGTLGDQAEKVLAYAEHLKRHFDMEVITWDERFSTVIAHMHLEEMNVKAETRRRVIDEAAAQVILQSYLDSLESSERK